VADLATARHASFYEDRTMVFIRHLSRKTLKIIRLFMCVLFHRTLSCGESLFLTKQRPRTAIQKSFAELAGKKPALRKSHFWFGHAFVNRVLIIWM